jgi:hypothetical protein
MQGVDLSISGYTKSAVIIDQEVGASVRSVVQTNCTGILWDGITSRYDNEGGPDWAASHNATWQCSGGVLNLLNCTIDNAVGAADDGSKQPISTLRKRWGGVHVTAGGYLIMTGGSIQRVRDGVVSNGSGAAIYGTRIRQVYEDCFTGTGDAWIIHDVLASMLEGTYVRLYDLTSTVGLQVGEVYTKGSQVIEVHAIINGTTIQGRINNYDLPSVGTFNGTGAASGKSISVTADNGEAGGLNIHGDFFQAYGASGSHNISIDVQRNIAFRETPQITDAINQECNNQGIYLQRAPSLSWSGRFHPATIRNNVIALGQAYGIKLQYVGLTGGSTSEIKYNTVLWAERGGRSDLEYNNCENCEISYNAGDNNQGGAVDDKGGNTNLTLTGNVFVDGNSGAQLANYNSPFTYPQSRFSFAAKVGSAVDSGAAGALNTSAAFR